MTEAVKDNLSNVPEFSVSELSGSLKRTVETTYARIRVRGELGRVTMPASGHLYTNLKDDGATIDAVCWKGSVYKLSVKPEEGLEVICTGRLTTYEKSSKYQMIIESMELAGEGALLKMLEERRKKLAGEGLFDESRKRNLPYIPGTIGVITSPTGAVIRDILHRLSDRFPRHVLVWPVLVQGSGAAQQIVAAIEGFNLMPNRPDLLIVARGGGSLEDLMPFNEEIVVRAAAASQIPLISAVGHETDTTLIDFAADRRAPTPTAAAEMAVPVRAEILGWVLEQQKRLLGGITRITSEYTHRLEAQARGLGDPYKLLEVKTQTLDHISDKIARVFTQYLNHKISDLRESAARIRHPRERLKTESDRLARWSEQLQSSGKKILLDPEKRLTHAGKMLEAYSFKNVLQRGFAVIRDKHGNILSDAQKASEANDIQIEFKDNQKLDATILKKA